MKAFDFSTIGGLFHPENTTHYHLRSIERRNSFISCNEKMNNSNSHHLSSTSIDQYHVDIQTIIDSYVTSVDNLSTNTSSPLNIPQRKNPSRSTLVTFDRDPALSENLTDEIRWLLIQYGPHQPREHSEHFLANHSSTNAGKGILRFRVKWFDDIRFADWLEYSFSTCRAYCFFCRLFADSNRNRAFSRDGRLTDDFMFFSFIRNISRN